MEDDEQREETKLQPAGVEAPREKWERRRDESERAYQAFSLYRDSDKRQLIDVAAKLNPPCSVQNVSRWAQRHMWTDRCWAFDVMREQEQEQQLARDRVSMRGRHLKISMVMQEIAVRGLQELQAKVAAGQPLNLSPDEVKSLMDAAVKLERVTLGTDASRKYTQILVNLGVHRHVGEPCGCDCPACAGCSGPSDGAPRLEAEGHDDPPKLN